MIEGSVMIYKARNKTSNLFHLNIENNSHLLAFYSSLKPNSLFFQRSKISKIGEALLQAALKDENTKRSQINLGPKSLSPKKMVLESVRLPKRKGKRDVESEEENLMSLQQNEVKSMLILLFIHSIITYLFIPSLFYLFIHLLIHLLIYSLQCPFIKSFIYLSIHSFIHKS